MRHIHFAFAVCLPVSVAAAQWTATVLDLSPGFQSFIPCSTIGDQWVGEGLRGNGVRGAVFWNGSSWVDLLPNGEESVLTSIDGDEQVGAFMDSPGGQWRACLWRGTAASRVTLHPQGAYNSIVGSTDSGQQGGLVQLQGGRAHAAVWEGTAESWLDIHPAGALDSRVAGVHAGSQVGIILTTDFRRNAALWSGTASSFVNLHPPGYYQSEATAVHHGVQVGWAQTSLSTQQHAGLWRANSASWTPLYTGPLPSEATAVHGEFQVGSISGNAFLWRGTPESAVNLAAVLPGSWHDSRAMDVWSDGSILQVVGYGRQTATSQPRGILWTLPLAPPCYANCDASTATPILNVADFTCFLQRFAAGDAYANCDQSTQAPTLNVADFTCFLQQFAAGCP